MKTLQRFLLPVLAIALLAGCIFESGDSRKAKKPGEVTLSLTVDRVGVLRKGSVISLQTLQLVLTAPGQDTLRDTLPLSGLGLQTHTVTYDKLSSEVTWTLDARTVDAEGQHVHADTVQFRVPSGGTRAVSVDLAARYSMFTARFFPIRDSVNRLELWVGELLRSDSAFAKQTRVGDTVALAYDYVPSSRLGTDNVLRLDAYGDFYGEPNVLLYRGVDTVAVFSGKDTSYSLTLRWMHPIPPPFGQAEIEVVVGALGSSRVDGEVAAPEAFAREWRLLGLKGFTPTAAGDLSMAHDPATDETYVSYRSWPGDQGHVMHYTGTSWQALGGPISAGGVGIVRVAVMPGGNPVAAFEDRANGAKTLKVVRWNGTSWDSLPGSQMLAPMMGDALSLTLDAAGDPVIAFQDGANDNKLSVIRWDGIQWQAVGAPGFTPTTHLAISLAVDRNDRPVLAFVDGANAKGSVMRWNGSDWAMVGAEIPGVESPSLALDAAGNPVIAFQDHAKNFALSVMRWDGAAWQHVGSATEGVSQGEGGLASLAFSPAGHPIVAYRDNQNSITVKRWSGNEWRSVVSPSISAGSVESVWLSLDANGFPLVGYSDVTESGKATVLYLSP